MNGPLDGICLALQQKEQKEPCFCRFGLYSASAALTQQPEKIGCCVRAA
jgi:hypothetical protein